MFLGTPRAWWIITGICFLVGLALATSGAAGTPGVIVGVILVFVSIIIFAGAPMRYGERARARTEKTPSQAPPIQEAAPAPPRPRANIEGRDASEV